MIYKTLTIFLFISHGLNAQCDTNIVADNSYGKYAYINRGDRCEGFYKRKVKGDSISLLSITYGDFKFNPVGSEVIKISCPKMKGTVKFKADGILRDLNYRLDCKFEAKNGFEWPVKDVLLQNKDQRTHHSDNIGILAQIANYFVPVLARGKSLKPSTVLPPIKILIKSSTKLKGIEWNYQGNNQIFTLPGSKYLAEQVIRIELSPTNLKGNKVIEIRAFALENDEEMAMKIPIKL